MRLSELLNENEFTIPQYGDGFFINPLNPLSKSVINIENFGYFIDNDNIIEHVEYIKQHPELFGLTKNEVAGKNRTELLNTVDKKGWIRGIREDTHYFGLQSNNMKNIHKAALILSENVGLDVLLIESDTIFDLELMDEKLEYFLKHGKIPQRWLTEAQHKDELPEYINYNGQQKPTRNSLGNYIGTTVEVIESFYNWFGNSKVVDEKGRPLVAYHGTNKEFSELPPN